MNSNLGSVYDSKQVNMVLQAQRDQLWTSGHGSSSHPRVEAQVRGRLRTVPIQNRNRIDLSLYSLVLLPHKL